MSRTKFERSITKYSGWGDLAAREAYVGHRRVMVEAIPIGSGFSAFELSGIQSSRVTGGDIDITSRLTMGESGLVVAS